MNAPNRVLKYKEHVNKAWKNHKISQRIDNICDQFKSEGPTQDNIDYLYRLDAHISEIMKGAEKRCTKMHPMHTDTWSVQLDQASKAVYELKYQLKQLKKVFVGNVKHIDDQVRDVDNAIVLAKEHYKQVKKDHKKHRNDHLDNSAKYNIEHNNGLDIKKEIKAIKHIEEQIRIAAKIGYVLKPRQFDSNSGILIPDIGAYTEEQRSMNNFDHIDVSTIWDRIEKKNGKDIGRWERVTQKNKVKEMLIAWQCKHFTQSCLTPFVTKEWTELLMDEEVQNKIMDGSFKPPDSLTPLAKVYLMYLKRDKRISVDLPFSIDFKKFW